MLAGIFCIRYLERGFVLFHPAKKSTLALSPHQQYHLFVISIYFCSKPDHYFVLLFNLLTFLSRANLAFGKKKNIMAHFFLCRSS